MASRRIKLFNLHEEEAKYSKTNDDCPQMTLGKLPCMHNFLKCSILKIKRFYQWREFV